VATSRRQFLGQLLAASPAITGRHLRFFHTNNFFGPTKSPAQLAADPLRPQLHLLPAKNWMNDPNGPIFWNGMYHMFFQYNPNAAVWGDMHWAHAISPDMIHWKHLPIALAPTPGWADADGCFTGSAVNDRGTVTFIYTGVKTDAPAQATLRDGSHNFREVQCLATSKDPRLLTWEKWKTPIIEPPADPQLTGFRDPLLWQDRDVWYLGIASGIFKQGGRVLLYRSKDLRQWEYLHPLASGKWTEKENINPVDSGEMWECPDFFQLGSKHVLLYSTAGSVVWESGELDPKELVFHSQRKGFLDHGAYYAQKTQLDANGNRILWGWIPETRPETEFSAAGWAGCMSLPRVLSLNAQFELEMKIAQAARSLRAKQLVDLTSTTSAQDRSAAIKALAIDNLAAEVAGKFKVGPFTLSLVDEAGPWWTMSATPSAASLTLKINEKSLTLPSPASQVKFHLLLDASVAEVFTDDLHALTSRIYRPPAGKLRLQISAIDAPNLLELSVWQLNPISPDRLTT
jgi:beta-fructofuranosidase